MRVLRMRWYTRLNKAVPELSILEPSVPVPEFNAPETEPNPPEPSVLEAQTHSPHDVEPTTFGSISSWNCRGLRSAIPYVHHLIADGADIIAVSEHWLWPYQLESLKNIHPEYKGYGVSDRRLNAESTFTRGCGGTGFIWNKSIQVFPLTDILSDRICAIRVILHQSTCVNVVCAYLPSSDHPFEEFRSYVNDLASIASALESSGPIIILGDINAHLCDYTDIRARLLHEVIASCDLYIVSSSSIATGPGYTFFSGNNRTSVDHILTNTFISHHITKCYTHYHHELNLSDHLPLSLVLKVDRLVEDATSVNPKLNWKKAVKRTPHFYLLSESILRYFLSTLINPIIC